MTCTSAGLISTLPSGETATNQSRYGPNTETVRQEKCDKAKLRSNTEQVGYGVSTHLIKLVNLKENFPNNFRAKLSKIEIQKNGRDLLNPPPHPH